MRPIDQFLSSVQESFAENRSTNWARLGLSILVLVAMSVAMSAWLRRRRRRRAHAAQIQAVLSRAGLSDGDFADLTRIAAAGEVPVLEVMTRLAPFEHATARWIADEAPAVRPSPNSRFERVRRLRRALGFSPLSAHLWLLSTRELATGDSVSTNGVHGHVAEVNEASFAFEWPVTAALAEGATVSITIERPDDARYLARVQVLQSEAIPAVDTATGARVPGSRVFFSHDENPERQQDREFSRLRIDAAIKIQVIDAPVATGGARATVPAPLGSAEPISGKMVDVSAGGLSLNVPVSPAGPVLRGSHVRCWFTLDEHATFEALIAVVVDARALAGSRSQNLRLAFTELAAGDRDRLAAAVARHQRTAPASASGRA
jgi:preprotein translocase subunit YajC